MANLDEIIKINKEDPELSARQIARMVGCRINQVHEVSSKKRLDIPSIAKITLPKVSFLEREFCDV